MPARHRLVAALALVAWAVAAPASAHWADNASIDVAVSGRQATATLTAPTGLLGGADADHDGTLSAAEIAAHRGELEALLRPLVVLEGDGEPATLAVVGPDPRGVGPEAGKAHSALALAFTWPGPGAPVAGAPVAGATLRYALFAPDAPEARCLAQLSVGGAYQNGVLKPAAPTLQAGAATPWWKSVGRFVASGVEHILLGFDHVLFLVALLMVGGGLWSVVGIVTAFTAAHSITLALAVLGYVRPPSSVIEPLIALTIAYVAAENFWRAKPDGRWLVAFGFGLIHGFGFAGALGEAGLPPERLALSLVSFNLGVELGQLLIVATLAALLAGIKPWRHERQARLAISGLVVGCGLFWFVERIAGGG